MSIDFDQILDGWQKREDNEDNCKENQEELLRFLQKQQSNIRQQDWTIDRLKQLAKEYPQSSKELHAKIRTYVAQSEIFFLSGKKLINFIEHESLKISAEQKLHIYGKWMDNRYSLKKIERGYLFILPPMTSQYKRERRLQEGRAIYEMVLYLIDEFQKEESLECFSDADITFRHYIDRNLPEISVPDADNVDIKKVIDAMQGFIIKSDNLLHLNLSHEGFLSDWAHTEIYVKERKKGQQNL